MGRGTIEKHDEIKRNTFWERRGGERVEVKMSIAGLVMFK